MFFMSSKILWYLLNPFNIILLFLILGWLLYFKKPIIGKILVGTGLILIFLFGLSPIPNFLIRTLENRISAGTLPDRIDGIIILAGSIDIEASRPGLIELSSESDRIIGGVILAQKHPEAKLIITGGSGYLDQSENLREADYMQKLAILLGITKDRIFIDRNSRNTHEHVVELFNLLPNKDNANWVLITSAFHMPRAFTCFRKAGIKVIPYPLDYKTKFDTHNALSISMLLPTLGNINRFNIALHEWVGLVVYRLLGYTDSVFPRTAQ